MAIEKGRFKEFNPRDREMFFYYWGTKDGLKGYYRTAKDAFDTLVKFPALAELKIGSNPEDWNWFKSGFWEGQQKRFEVERKQAAMDALIKRLLKNIEVK
jgi:hypothetical protein